MKNTMSPKRLKPAFPQIPHPSALVFCSGKEGLLSLSIMTVWDEFYVADEHGEGKLSEEFASEDLAFECIKKITSISYGEKYSIWQF